MLKTVPVEDPSARLRTRTEPRCLRMICSLTQRPRPVPVASLVVKKGSKMWRRASWEMPQPVSATETRTPRVPFCHELWARTSEAAAVGGHRVKGVANEVGEELAELAGEAEEGEVGWVVALEIDLEGLDAAEVEGDDGVEELADIGDGGEGGLAVEAQGLLGDFGDAGDFLLGELGEAGGFRGEALLADEVEEVGDGFEGVVDLVGDGGGETAGGGELFGAAEGFLAALLLGDVDEDGADPAGGVGLGADGVEVGEPAAGAVGLGLPGEFEVADGFAGLEDGFDVAFELGGGSGREDSGDAAAEMESEGVAIHVGEELIDADEAVFAVEEGEADGGVGEHGVEQGQGLVEAGALILHGGDHAIEGDGELGGFSGGLDGEREFAGIFRVLDEVARGAGEQGELAGDGLGEEGGDDGAGAEDEGGPEGGDAQDGVEVLDVLVVVGVDPGEGADAAIVLHDGGDDLPLVVDGLKHDGLGERAEVALLALGKGDFADGSGVGAGQGEALEVSDLGGADAGGFGDGGDDAGEGARAGVGEGERAERAHLKGLAFEAAVHALIHFAALLMKEEERKNADDEELEEHEGGHELAANRSWSEHRHKKTDEKRAECEQKTSEKRAKASRDERKTSHNASQRRAKTSGPKLRSAPEQRHAAFVSGPRQSGGRGSGRSR